MKFNTRQCVAEAIGTYCLVFAGTAAIITNDTSGGVVTHVGIALTFGLIVLAMIYTIGDISGAHINPAVTLGFVAAGRMSLGNAASFIVAQLVGAIVASLTLWFLFPDHATLGATIPSGSVWQSFILEVILTAMLMFVILNVSTGAKEKGITAGIAIGAVVALEAMFAGPISGASMNPARSIGPALVSMNLTSLWVYIAAPILGAMVAVINCRTIHMNGCCEGGNCEPNAIPDESSPELISLDESPAT